MTILSDYYLLNNGWRKDGNLRWVKGLDLITYDGCNFMYYKFPECVKIIEGEGVEIQPTRIEYCEDVKR